MNKKCAYCDRRDFPIVKDGLCFQCVYGYQTPELEQIAKDKRSNIIPPHGPDRRIEKGWEK